MKKIFFIYSLFAFNSLNAQDLSLNDAFRFASSYKVDQSNLELQIQQIQLNIIKKQQLPNLQGELSIQRNLIIPVTPVPSIAFDPNAPHDQYTPLKFATNWNAKTGLLANWDVYNPKNQWSLKENQFLVEKAALSNQITAIDLKNDIIKKYAQAYLAQQQYQLAIENENNYQEIFQIITDRFHAGRATKIDLNNAEVKKIQLESTRKEAAMVLYSKQLSLMSYLDVSKYDNFSTTIDEMASLEINDDRDLQQQLLLLDIKLKNYEADYIKKSNLPTISLNGYYGAQFFNNDLKVLNIENWYGNSYVGLSLKLPISNWLQLNNDISKLATQQKIYQSKLDELKANNKTELLDKTNAVKILKEKIQYQSKVVQLAKENMELSNVLVDEGRILLTEHHQTIENSMEQYKILWQYQYDLIEKLLE